MKIKVKYIPSKYELLVYKSEYFKGYELYIKPEYNWTEVPF